MNGCMMAHATREEQDRAREEWFITREKRRKEREEKQAKRKEQEKFHHDYWGLDEHGRRLTDRSQIKKVEELVDPGK
jgi:COX assembly mitochondrial protein 1